MPVSRLTCSVVICAYTDERWKELIAAVGSVRDQSVAPVDIILVVDHNPQLLERARIQFSDVVVLENNQARGLSGARNSGVAAARGEIIAFVDDDAIAAPDWLEQLLAGYNAPEVMGVGGTIAPLWHSCRPAWFPHEFDWVVGCTYSGMPEAAAPVRNLIGANMSFRRAVFEEIGGFRAGIGRVGALPVGCEETELCIRVQQRWPWARLYYRPWARVAHSVTARRARWSYFRSRCSAEGRSKALVAQIVGANDGLASERAYTLYTLPRGVLRGLADTLLRRDLSGLARSGAIIAGLIVTTVGYIGGAIDARFVHRSPAVSTSQSVQTEHVL